jgi:multiple sugar transport system permease protein
MRIISCAAKAAVLKRTKNIAGGVLIYGLLLLLVWVIVAPFIVRISISITSEADMFDPTVTLIPRQPTLDYYRRVIRSMNYFMALGGSFLVSGISALAQTFICAMTGYALAKLKGKLAGMVMLIVVLTILIPPQVVMIPLFLQFRFFDFFGLFTLITGRPLNLNDSAAPITILSLTGFGLKNGLFIFVMRQFFKGVPEELEEAALIDGYDLFRTYLRIILPISVPMLVTIFILAFSWQWTDTFYSDIFFSSFPVVARTTFIMDPLLFHVTETFYQRDIILHAGVLLAIIPLIVLFVAAQKWLITGIERSGIVG